MRENEKESRGERAREREGGREETLCERERPAGRRRESGMNFYELRKLICVFR